MTKIVEWHETPDIEVEADEWEDQQQVLRDLAAEDGLEDARGISECEARIAAMEDREDPFEDFLMGTDPYAGINSCDALRIIDGIDPELDGLDADEQRIIDEAKAVGVPL